jgi:hypothetical protein
VCPERCPTIQEINDDSLVKEVYTSGTTVDENLY